MARSCTEASRSEAGAFRPLAAAAATVLATTLVPVHARSFSLVENGEPKAVVVLAVAPSAQARQAAQELQTFVRRISGAELRIVAETETAAAAGPRVFVGVSTAVAAMGLGIPTGLGPDFADEGYVVHVTPGLVVLAGNETEPYSGTLFAVYDLLESLGCRWYFPGAFGEVVPEARTLRLPVRSEVRRPALRVRDVWYSGHLGTTAQQQNEFATWRQRTRHCRYGFYLNGQCADARWLQNPTDDSTWRLLPKETYWDAHPEYYAMNAGGTRNERFVCMSNGAALDAAAETITAFFAAHPDFHCFAFSPPDEPVLCRCPGCTQAMNGGGFGGEGNGQASDAYFAFVMRLADKLAGRCPGKWLATMAYYNRCRPPEGVEGKRPNLYLQLASIQQCSLHSYADRACWSRQQYAAMLERWSELTAGQVFYEYDPHDWTHLQRPTWRSQGIAEDLRLLQRGGGWGFSNEGQMAWLSTGLNYYVRSRLAWDLSLEPEEVVADFAQHFFGPAAKPMLAYYRAIETALADTPLHGLAGGAPDDITAILDPPLLERGRAWLDAAARSASAEPYSGRVAAFRAHFDRIEAFAKARACLACGEYREAVAWGETMSRCVERVNDSALLQEAGPWGGALCGKAVADYARSLVPWVDGSRGRLVAALPAAARFRQDPAAEGVVQRWYRPPYHSKEWRSLRMSTAWHNQGILAAGGRHYIGVGWYRVSLSLTTVPAADIGLLFPESKRLGVWVWCNGNYAGMATTEGEQDLRRLGFGRGLRAGSNELVLRVSGDGGLALPPVLFEATDAAASSRGGTEVPVFPSDWTFRTDPDRVGEAEGWHKPGFAPGAGWRTLPVTGFWDERLGQYSGEAWYRVQFRLPAEVKDRRLVLRFGAVDEEAWVYVNGEFVGEHTTASTGQTIHQIWDQPFEVPLRHARPGEDNLLAVRVRNSALAGGIFRPVQLFAFEP